MTSPQRRAVRAYQRGATAREIAADLGVHEATVRRWLAAREVPLRSRGPRPFLPTRRIAQLRGRGAAWQKVADEVGASKTGVRKHYYRAAARLGDDLPPP